MKCTNCGRRISAGITNCPRCGGRIHYDGNTVFYGEARQNRVKLSDLFSEVMVKHPKGSVGEVFIGGTVKTTPTKANMLNKWQRPWLFSRFLALGILFCVMSYLLYILFGHPLGWILLDTIGAMVLPLTVLIFFWELNIPRNIPIYTVLGVFMIGGVLSLIITLLEHTFLPDMPSYLAPLTEEPGKVLAAMVFLMALDVEYGLNGLLIGAAVGAGFACFENIYYIIFNGFFTFFSGTGNYPYAVEYSIDLFLLRNLGTLGGGHTFWCTMEAGALMLAKGREKLSWKHLGRRYFLQYFVAAMGIHALWNSGMLDLTIMERDGVPVLTLSTILCTALSVALVMWLLKPCIVQVMQVADEAEAGADIGYRIPTPIAAAKVNALSLCCLKGPQQGKTWSSGGEMLVIGRDHDCGIRIPAQTPGVSHIHCSIQRTSRGWTVKDLNSKYGTYTSRGRMMPGEERVIVNGEIIYLGSTKVAFQVIIQ